MKRKQNTFKVGNVKIEADGKLFIIAGPCVIESKRTTLLIAGRVKDICKKVGVGFIFKASYDKANRSSADSYRGPGIDKGLDILAEVKAQVGVPILSDIHCRADVGRVSEVLDIIQIPAYLSRQSDLIMEAVKTGLPVNIKKGQFMAPSDMENVVEKVRKARGKKLILTERGYSFGYNNLVVDFRAIVAMKELGVPIVYDATHSVQLPGGQGTSSGGEAAMILPLARAAAAVGVDGIFMEVHPNPAKALCDGPNSLKLDKLEKVLKMLKKIHKATSS